ncbi:PREDICTED: peroxisomal acyl-coenzyme A oxidase 2 [Nanorana parkeri]|uniref:peroxisomal acyl-coenzyme A oxidase 2 n=1 Tax=Nanorana parkeri TaxID=125878 RepID=UPI000854C52F|nr:PREDICTED: peroxisomal acyl-coenzyme A oxidase 2 [Nanorana parkeri]XP_018417951.1 PREDICTED: peroxisomal acyl-coenzyme A oxidase 2 [Nanorana parkeri]
MAWWKVSSAGKDVNPDLAIERESPSFNVETLINILHGGAEETRLRRSVVTTIQKDPVFSLEDLYFKTRAERYEGAIRNAFHLKKKFKEFGWEDNGPEVIHAYRALSGEYALNIHNVFTQSLNALGTDQQIAKWLPLATNYQILGTYAQTELGHGTYLRGLETTATFDPKTQEFIVDTPNITATKWWPGDLGKTCTHALVLAQLHSMGKKYGMHPFIVPVRSLKDHSPLPGITVGDIGPKMSFDQVDNGYLMMRNIRIPKENMLSRFSEVLPDGSYVKRGSDQINYFTMISVRVSMIGNEVVDSLKKACTIAVRYSAVRRQSELKPRAQEAKILDYQTQQQKLLPLLATCYSIHFMATYVAAVYNKVFKEIRVENFSSLAELHAITSGIKAFATEICSNGVEVCRKACGGHGYSLYSGLPTLYTRVVASCTYEGENTVLHLQVARFLIKCFAAAQSGKPLPQTTSYLSTRLSSGCQANTHLDFLNPDVYMKAYESRAYRLIASAANKLHRLVQSGTEQYEAWNNTSVELVKASIAHIHYLTVKTFTSAVSTLSTQPEIKTVLKRLCDLYALHGIFTSAGDFLQHGYLSGKQLELATTAYLGLLAELRKDAVLLVDAFDYSDQQLISALGTYDGNVYHNLLEWSQRNPDIKKVSPVFEKYLKPYLQSNQSKL